MMNHLVSYIVRDQILGRTICNRVVNFQSNDTDLVGQIVNIQINEALPNCLRGNLQN